ncbi:MAG: bifunctional folylpolyglutamate synthase/dihydrofolate synthase [Bacteroidetes bacterium]|nr:bifunctional folylpolyglutamate synthase/dihydrofolate synthase [Bacteroidota bacterium]MBV6461760.1 Folylpolyglutamate synthase [Flavobacteriales bacterium]WKZ75875.1 MAG: folylpolyglutamate synthase/dihydrofolate synthase family protein [Vicingaceae bacterium]MCL4816747.1 bifunctional folylpolyglutamate synthase/dihydrofolate synthase [Flavobacteriales bacterium]NOG95551.1 bifunctional folylpolyglutamate synthase/dihydrofolate synthase [Bacteroidota bacterium]
MNYQQTLDYLFSQLPMYQRVGKIAYKADLNNTIELCRILKNPQLSIKTIHIAGTNGKGSVSHMLASIFQEAGYKTGLYTSPHLIDFRERIKINGNPISKKEVVSFVRSYKTEFKKIHLSFFEWSVGLAFYYFKKQKVDIAIIEVGLGGRLDSTNVITPEISVITNISLDHQALLGNTIKKIAQEKAGIIKKNIPVVIGETQRNTAPIFTKTAQQKNAPIFFADQFSIPKFHCELKGLYQQKNIRTVYKTCKIVSKKRWVISEKHIDLGIRNVIKNTGLQGRWQTINTSPLIICDTAHNRAGIKEVVKQIRLTPHRNLHMVFGMVNDKDILPILKLLPKKAHYYFCKPSVLRGLESNILKHEAEKFNLKGEAFVSVEEATKIAIKKSKANDLIFMGGSTFVVADALIFLKK